MEEGSTKTGLNNIGEKMSTKQTPKSCSCRSCKRGKHTRAGHLAMKKDERAFRHAQNAALKCGRGGYSAAPVGNYYD
jgi:hypothetical protein